MRKKARISKARRFAVFARKELISNVLNRNKNINQQIAEEVAYTWFNRFTAIRYMEVNGYLDETEEIFHFRTGEEDFIKRILGICYRLAKVLPEVFEDKSPIIQELIPRGMGTLEKVISRMINDIDESQWHQSVEIIGWLYQYYNGERKKEVFKTVKNNKRIRKEDLPVATQLFTPEWLVEYMVENSLGRLWIENLKMDQEKNHDKIQEFIQAWRFYIPNEKVAENPLSVEAIKVIDPCVGSGHILSYVFDFLMEIYIKEGYSKEDAADLIVSKNLYGLEIDRRAIQMAYFTLIMKGLEYDPDFLSKGIKLNICELDWNDKISQVLKKGEKKDLTILEDIKEYGSLLNVNGLNPKTKKVLLEVPWGKVLEDKYQVVITNPPYMTMYNMSPKLVDYVKENYPDSKHDLFSAFMEKCEEILEDNGYKAMVTQHSWMFLSVYKELRKKVLEGKIISLLHLGTRGFEEILGDIVQTVAFVIMKSPAEKDTVGCYKRLVDGNCEEEKIQDFFKEENTYYVEQENFKELPGWTLTYWHGVEFFRSFKEGTLKDYYLTKKGMFTGNNEYFLKKWYEVPREKIGTDFLRYNKGGRFRKWYGCNDTVVKWHNDGAEIKGFKGAGNINENWFYKTCLSWNLVSAFPFCCRIVEKGAVMGDAGPICVIEDQDPNYYYILAYLNSMVAREFLNALNPTMNYPSGVVGSLPIRFLPEENKKTIGEMINELVKENIEISKDDWNSYETAMDFDESPLVKYIKKIDGEKVNGSILEACYEKYKKDTNEKFAHLKTNEEMLNKEFINIFHLENHITPKEEDRDLTLTYVCDYKEEISENLKGCRYVKYMEDIVIDFLSYIVGCLIGRFKYYDENKIHKVDDGIIYINDNEDFKCRESKNHHMANKDIAGMIIQSVGKIFGQANIETELEFIKKALGAGQGKNPEKVLRKYFKKYFYRDHLKTYGRRPIYWQFDSGKNCGCRCLVYYHQMNQNTVEKIINDYVYPKENQVEEELNEITETLQQANVKIMRKRSLEKRLGQLEAQRDELVAFKENLVQLKGEQVQRDEGVLENYKKFSKVLSKI